MVKKRKNLFNLILAGIVVLIVLSAILFICFSILVSAANLDLVVNSSIDGYSADVRLKTNPLSGIGFDAYDFDAPSLPSNGSSFYSVIPSHNLSIDSWNISGNPRTLNLSYIISYVQNGSINFTWTNISDSDYNATLYYYWNDSTYGTLNQSVDMRANISFLSASLFNNKQVYIKINVSSIFSLPLSFIDPTPASGTKTANRSFIVNLSIPEGELNEVKFNWNGTNYTVYNESLVLMMNFDNVSSLGESSASNFTADASKYNNSGNCTGMGAYCNWTSGKYGKGINFDGSNDYVNLTSSSNLDLIRNYTISFWIYSKNNLNYRGIVERMISSKGYSVWMYTSGQLWLTMDGYAAGINSGSSVITANTWEHWTVTFNTTTTTWYKNGVYANSGADSPASTVSTNLLIGRQLGTVQQYFNGTIDEVSIWNRTLSAAEVNELYMANLQKYNSTQWYLYLNQSKNSTTGLDDATYTYQASVKDSSNNENSSEERNIIISSDATPPEINFTSPTLANASVTSNSFVEVNVSIGDNSSLNEVKFNWNGTNFTIYNDTLVFMYNFENFSSLGENASYIVDMSKYGNNGNFTKNGTLNGYNSSGKHGGTWTFDGDGDYITSANNLDMTGNNLTTWSAWVKINLRNISNGNSQMVMYWGSNVDNKTFGIGYFNTSKTLFCSGRYGGYNYWVYTPVIYEDIWYHVTCVYDGNNITSYFNGAYSSTKNYIANISLSPVYIGRGSTTASCWNGSIDEVRIYNRSFSASEVSELYFSNLQKFNSTLWYLYVNQSKNSSTGLDNGAYTYFASAKDSYDNENLTETRTVNVESGTNVTMCRDLTNANTVYTQTADINQTQDADCIRILASNITYNGNGKSITVSYADTNALYSDQQNTTIRNCNITGAGLSTGIFLNGSNNSYLFNNNLSALDKGLFLSALSLNNIIENIRIINNSQGISLSNSSYNTITNVTSINNTGGIYLTVYSRFNNLSNIVSLNNSVYTGSNYAIKLENYADDNLIKDSNFSGGVEIGKYSSNNIYLNCTYDLAFNAGGSAIRKWYYRAYVNDSNGNPQNNINVSVYYNNGTLAFNLTTNSSGYTDLDSIAEDGMGDPDYLPYYIYAGNTTLSDGHSYNVTFEQNNLMDVFTLNNYGTVLYCQNLTVANNNYALQENINQSSDSDCIIITASNITFNCYGYSITSMYNKTGIFSNQSNTTIKNCIVSMGEGDGGYGIEIQGSNNSYIYNNTLYNQSMGLVLEFVNNTRVQQFNLSSNSFYMNNSYNNTIWSSNGYDNGYGIYYSSNNNFTDIVGAGFGISYSLNNQINFLNISTLGDAFYLISSNNTIVKDSLISSPGGEYYDIYLSSSKNNTFINTTYNILNENVDSDSQLIRKWYYKAFVNYTNGSGINSANVTGYNFTGSLFFNLATNSSGWINTTEVTEYVNNGTVRNYYNNYTINATKSGYNTVAHSYNFTIVQNKLNDIFTLNDTLYPQFSGYWANNASIVSGGVALFNVTVNNSNGTVWLSINGTNYTATNLSALSPRMFNVSTTDLDAGTYSYNWSAYGNGTSHLFNISDTKSYTVNVTAIIGTEINECRPLNETGVTYILTSNVTSNMTCFNITEDNVTLNCNGYAINYSANGTIGYGIYSNKSYSFINNCTIKEGSVTTNSKFAIYFNSANNGSIQNNTITTIGAYSSGMRLLTSSNNTIFNNTITTSGTETNGIYLVTTANFNNITNNTITTSGSLAYGIYLNAALYNNLSGNKVNTSASNSYVILGTTLARFNNTITPDNLAEGKPVNYTYNADNLVFNGTDFTSYGQVIFAWSRNITIVNSNFSDDSLNLFYTNNSRIQNNTIDSSEGYGIFLYSSSNYNNITNNSITTSGIRGCGIFLQSSSNNNNILNNTMSISGSTAYGIYLYSTCNNNNILDNIITTTQSSAYGMVLLIRSNSNNFSNIKITTSGTSGYGIYFGSGSNNNSFSNMDIKTNRTTAYGIYLYDNNNNFTFTDSFINSSVVGDFYLSSAVTGGSFNFTNVTKANGDNLNITWPNGADGTMYMKWHLDVNVTDSNGALDSAIVNASYSNGTLVNNLTTGSSGIVRLDLLEFTQNNTGEGNKTYIGNYTVNVTKSGYTDFGNTTVNMSTNVKMDVVMSGSDAIAPGILITYPGNLTYSLTSMLFNVSSDENMSFCRITLSNWVTNYTMTVNSSNTGANYTNTSIANGAYKAQFWCNDTFGNINDTESVSFTVDTTNPSINWTEPTPPNGNITANNWVYLNTSIYDSSNYSGFFDFDNDLVGYWSFEYVNSTGTVFDNSSYSNNGLMNNFASNVSEYSNGKFGKGLLFDGADDYVNIGDISSLEGMNKLTLGAWVKIRENDATDDEIMSKFWDGTSRSWKLWINSDTDDKVTCIMPTDTQNDNDNVVSNDVFPLDEWHHVICQWNGSSILMYIDGVLQTQVTAQPGNSIRTNSAPAQIGADYNTGTIRNYINGSIDEVRIWNRTLSPEEINASYNAGLYKLYHNFTGLVDSNYTYRAFAVDSGGNMNITSYRSVSVDTTAPEINFTLPTSANGTTTANTSVEVNVSIANAADLDDVKFNWNGTNFTMYNDSLVLMMNFDNLSSLGENSTYAVDVSHLSLNNATSSGTSIPVLNTTGKYNNQYEFDGSNDIFEISDTNSGLDGLDYYTIAAWIIVRGNGVAISSGTGGCTSHYPIIAKGYGIAETTTDDVSFFIGLNSTGRTICFDFENHTGSLNYPAVSASSLANGTYYHIVAMHNNTGNFVYINGDYEGKNVSAVITPTRNNHHDVGIGRACDGTVCTGAFKGGIDEVRIWNRSLSAAEIQEQYFMNLQKFNSTLWYLYVNQSKNSTSGLTDGAYTYFASGKDVVGNENLTETRWLTVHTVAPGLNITYPENATTYTVNVSTLNYTITETGGSCWYSNSSGAWNSTSVAAGTNFTNVISVEGSNNWTVYCNDSYGNKNSSNVSFTKWTGTNLADCTSLLTANATYTLKTNIINNSVSASDNGCIVISAQNITLNCAGYYISSTSNNSGVYSAQWNTTVKNCNISMGQGNNTESLGIELTDAADYSIIYNNTVWDYGTNGMYYGIVTNAENQNITNNNINVTCINCRSVLLSAANDNELRSNIGVSNSNYGIYLSSSNNNILINNTARSESSHGFYILSSDNTTFYNNTGITASSSTSVHSIYFYYADNCTLDYNTGISITGSPYQLTMYRCLSNVVSHQNSSGGTRAALLQQTNHTIIKDCINVSGSTFSFRVITNSTNNTVLNCSSYSLSTESLTDNSELIRKWYYQAYVNYTNSTPVNNANVSAYNVTDNLEFSSLTNSSGWINRTEITEYMNTGGTRAYYSNYTINATDNINTVSHSLNITDNKLDDNFQLILDAIAPGILITYPGNLTYSLTSMLFNVSSDENMSFCRITLSNWVTNYTMTVNSSNTGANYTNTSIANGAYKAQFWCNDTFGNINDTESVSFTVDTTNPSINWTEPTPPNGNITANNWVYLNTSIYDSSNYSGFFDFDNDLVGYWSFEYVNSTGTVFDNSSYSNNGLMNNFASNISEYSNGKFGKGLLFDGADDYVSLTNQITMAANKSFVIIAWFNTNTISQDGSGTRRIINFAGGVSRPGLGITSTSIDCFMRNITGTTIDTSTTAISVGSWYHVVCMYDENTGNASIYINGVRKSTSIIRGGTEGFTRPMTIGAIDGTSGRFNGSIDEVRIWNRTLSPEEINASYNAGLYKLYHNFTGLVDSNYIYRAFAVDSGGNMNITSYRSVSVDTTAPEINFTAPTFANGTTTANTSVEVNVTISEANLSEVKFNWNGTNFTLYNDSLVLYMNFDNLTGMGESSVTNFSADLSKNNYSGNCSGMGVGCNYTTGKYGKGMFFYEDDKITLPDIDNNLLNEVTISAWIYPLNAAGEYQGIAGSRTSQGLMTFIRVSGFVFDIKNTSNTRVILNKGRIVNDQWQMITGTYNGSLMSWYINDTLVGTDTGVTGPMSDYTYGLIGYAGTGVQYFNGSIDEVRIYNRTFSASEVSELYFSNLQKFNSTQWYLYVNQSKNSSDGLDSGLYSYFASGKDNVNNENITEKRYITISSPSSISNLWINSSDGTNKTLSDLNCNGTLTDPESDRMNVTIEWYKNNVLNLTLNYTNSSNGYINGSRFVATLDDLNTTKNENWSCGVRVYDGYSYSSWTNSSKLRILNSVPNITGLSPANNNLTTNRTPVLNWSTNDDDDDALTFEINLTLVASSLCSDTRTTLGTSSGNNYTVSPYLKCLIDNGDRYNWSVRAFDNENYSNWSTPRNISVQSEVTISLPVASINFGTVIPGNIDNTSDASPAPFNLRNDGNVLLNITANFSNLWNKSVAQNPSKYYQFKARNATSQCFEYASSVTSWTNATTANISVIKKLNFTSGYQTGCNNASIDIAMEVPSQEPPANRSSLVTFTAGLGELY